MPGVLITDAGRDQLLLVDDLAAPSPQWFGTSGSGDKQWRLPWGIATAPDGFVVSDSGNDRIAQISDADGSNWSALGSHGSGDLEFDRPAGVAVDAQGRIYVADLGNARIVRVDDIDGNGWTTYGTPGAPSAADPDAVGRFHEPIAVAADRTSVTIPQHGGVTQGITGQDGPTKRAIFKLNFDSDDGEYWFKATVSPEPPAA